MDNKRQLVRINSGDFVSIELSSEVGKVHQGKGQNFTLAGICFSSDKEWQKGQVLLINYFIPEELDSVKLKMMVIWSEFIDPEQGYFCGGEITEVEEAKKNKFANYYFQKLQERFFKRE
jgi:hypothetical protein